MLDESHLPTEHTSQSSQIRTKRRRNHIDRSRCVALRSDRYLVEEGRLHVGGLPSGQESLSRRPFSAHPRLVSGHGHRGGRQSKFENTANRTAANATNAKNERSRATIGVAERLLFLHRLFVALSRMRPLPSIRPPPHSPPSRDFFLITNREPTTAEREEGHNLSKFDGK